MIKFKILIQLISIYRAVCMFIFILFYSVISNKLNSLILITAILSDLLDGYLAKKFNLQTTGGELLDLFSDKYLNFISIIFLIIEKYPLLPLIIILTKEIFVLSFRSIKVDGEFIISTNRFYGGTLSFILWGCVLFHINNRSIFNINTALILLGIVNLLYLIYKVISNLSNIKKAFQIGQNDL